MDFLKAEMEKKRKAAEELAGGKKYIKRADVEAAREQQYWKEKLAIEEKKEKALEERLSLARGATSASSSSASASASSASANSNSHSLKSNPLSATPTSAGDPNVPGEEQQKADQAGSSAATSNISAKEVIKRLRKRGEPIRLFAETDEQRIARLRRLEDEAGENMEGQRNDFMKNMNELDRELDLESLKKKAEKEHGKTKEEAAVAEQEQFTVVPINYEKLKKDKGSVYMAIHDYFNVLLLEWEQELNSRPDEERRSRKGKSDQAIMQQSKEYLQPMFKLCKKKQLPDDILVNIVKICMNMQERDYVSASDTYCELSIGNAPWPIGVTMVGIHERSAREKISSNQVAHVLNDEKTRKWIQSMKRLMTFCQKKHPPEDLAKTIGWTKD